MVIWPAFRMGQYRANDHPYHAPQFTFTISDTRGPIGMKLGGCIELTLRLCNVIVSTSGRKSKPEVGLPHTISVLFWHEILPDDKENDLESNELCINIGETGNTGENRKFS